MINYKKPLLFRITKTVRNENNKESSSSSHKNFIENKTRTSWTKEEDEMVIALVEQLGTKNWTLLSKRIADDYSINYRSGKQCRERWHNHLDPNIKKDYWSEKEEAILFNKHKEFGNRWSDIAKFLSGRTDNAVKNHFYSKLRKFIRKIIKILKRENVFEKNNIDPLVYTSDKIYKIIKKQNFPYGQLSKDKIVEIILKHNNINNTNSKGSLEAFRISKFGKSDKFSKQDREIPEKESKQSIQINQIPQDIPPISNVRNFNELNSVNNLGLMSNLINLNIVNSSNNLSTQNYKNFPLSHFQKLNNISNFNKISSGYFTGNRINNSNKIIYNNVNNNNINSANYFNNNVFEYHYGYDPKLSDIYKMNLSKILPKVNQGTLSNFNLANNTQSPEKKIGNTIIIKQENDINNYLSNVIVNNLMQNATDDKPSEENNDNKNINTDINKNISFSLDNDCLFNVDNSNLVSKNHTNKSFDKIKSFNCIDHDMMHEDHINSYINITGNINNNFLYNELNFPININTNAPTMLEISNFEQFKNFCEMQQSINKINQNAINKSPSKTPYWKGFSVSPKSAFIKNYTQSSNFTQYLNLTNKPNTSNLDES